MYLHTKIVGRNFLMCKKISFFNFFNSNWVWLLASSPYISVIMWRTLLIHTQRQKTYLLFWIIQPVTVPANILIVQALSIPVEFGTLYTSHTWAKEIIMKLRVVEYRASLIQGAMQFFTSDILYCHWPGSWPRCSLTLPWILEGLREIPPCSLLHTILPHPLHSPVSLAFMKREGSWYRGVHVCFKTYREPKRA